MCSSSAHIASLLMYVLHAAVCHIIVLQQHGRGTKGCGKSCMGMLSTCVPLTCRCCMQGPYILKLRVSVQRSHASYARCVLGCVIVGQSASMPDLGLQALQHSQAAPSQGGAAIPEPQSPYIDVSQTAQAAAMHQMPIALATPAQPAQNPFGQTKNPFGKAQTPLGQASNPFGGNAAASAQPFVQAVVQQQAQQSGRIRFGQKAKGMSQQNLAQNPFQSASQPTGDPFGRPRPAQAMQPAQQNGMPVQAQNPFGQLQQQQPQQQQLPPGTPAPFAAFNGAHNLQNQSGFGAATAAGFETPAAQRPAFGGGVAASLQTPAEGAGPLPNAGESVADGTSLQATLALELCHSCPVCWCLGGDCRLECTITSVQCVSTF